MTINISDQLRKILSEYEDELKQITNEQIEKIAKETVQKLKETSPKKPGGGRYAKGWTLKRQTNRGGVTDIVVHNRTDYQLTHLLENGHVIRNKYGEYGRTKAIPHIEPVEQWAAEELPRAIEKELQ